MSLPVATPTGPTALVFHGTQALLALILTSTICYLAVQGAKVPAELTGALGIILGFYLRSGSIGVDGVPH